MMAKLQPWALMVVLLMIRSQPATCEDSETLHIISGSPCPGELTGEPCLTFSQYLRGDYRQYYTSDPSEIVLKFQPGHHTTGYSSTRMHNMTIAFQLSSFKMNSENLAEIYCDEYTQYQITNVQHVHISGINFVDCRLQSESVTNFILEESSLSQVQNFYFPPFIYKVLYILSSSATIIGCTFTNNYHLPLHIDNSSVELHHTSFISNEGDRFYANQPSGGALLIENTINTVTISNCSFIDNSAVYNGGVASIRNATVSILSGTFSQNRAQGNGGVFAVDDSDITIHDSMFDNNTAEANSGVFAVDDSEITIHDSMFKNNTAGANGGVFAVDDSEMTIYGSTFDSNTAGFNGGIISINYIQSALFISHTSFTNNKGRQGGVMYLRRKGTKAKISRSIIGFNNAIRGGFATVHGSSLEITTSNIFNNTAETGEVISACNSDISVSDQLTNATDPVYSVCTLISGNIGDTDLEPTTAATTDTRVDTTTIADISTTTNRAMATSETSVTTTTSQPTEPNITASVYFELNGKVYLNNSVIFLSEVGENENALLCKTDLVTCCGTQPYRFGEFHYPSGETVSVRKAERGFYRNRGAQVVRLNRREGVTSPTGKFRCAIPDASGTIQNLYIYLL